MSHRYRHRPQTADAHWRVLRRLPDGEIQPFLDWAWDNDPRIIWASPHPTFAELMFDTGSEGDSKAWADEVYARWQEVSK